MRTEKNTVSVYAITDRTWLSGRTLESQVEEAILGGASIVQLREKELSEKQFLSEAVKMQKLCRRYHVPLIINDNVAVALASHADGIHVGQNDREAGYVRKMLGPDKIIGVSAKTVEQARRAEQQGADYLGVGAVFHTGSKKDATKVSRETVKAICEAVKIPVVAIGGITLDNVEELAGLGISGVAVISAIFAQPDARAAAAALKEKVERMTKQREG